MRLTRWLPLGVVCAATILAPAQNVRTDAGAQTPSVVIRPDGTTWLWAGGDSLPEPIGLGGVVAGAVLGDQALLIRDSGALWKRSADTAEPATQVTPMPRVRAVSCGRDRCLMHTGADRLVWWTGGPAAEPISGIEDVAAAALGDEQAVAVTHTGRVWAWASKEGGAPPTPVPGLLDVVSVAAGRDHLLATTSDGAVWAWGANDAGQLGSGAPAARSVPDRVPGIERAVQVAARGDLSYALTEDGEVWAFGGGRPAPRRLRSPGEIVRLHAVRSDVLAERSDGRFWSAATGRFLNLPDPTGTMPAVEPPTEPPLSGRAYLIVGRGPLAPGDGFIRDRMKSLGLSTTLVEQGKKAAFADASLVVVSSTVDARVVDGAALGALGVPVVTWERFLFPPMGLTRRDRLPSHRSALDGRLSIIRPAHPLAAGLAGNVEVLQRPGGMTTGWPAAGAQVIAVARGGTPAIFAYDAGAETAAGVAPSRRVGLFLPDRGENLTTAGAALLDAALRWAVDGSEVGHPDPGGGGLEPEVGPILLVVAGPPSPCPGSPPLSTGDAVYKARMEALGFSVEVNSAPCALASDADGKAMVFVSHTASTTDVETEFLTVPTPVAVQNIGILDDMKMTSTANRGACSPPQSNATRVQTPSHPIANGLTGTPLMSASAGAQEWGRPPLATTGPLTGAISVLTCRDANGVDGSTAFTYERNAMMDAGTPAPHRRTFWSFHDPIPNTFSQDGQDLFDRMILWTTNTPNRPPTVDAGPDQAATTCERPPCTWITLRGHVFDDGLPNGHTIHVWAVESAPPDSEVTILSPNSLETEVLFGDETGLYVLRLSASDDEGQTWSHDYVNVTVYGQFSNEPPTVDAGPDQVVVFPGTATLVGTVTDEGLPNPPGAVTYLWSKVSGPGVVSFGTATAASTSATFSAAGKYVLRLTADDSELEAFDDVEVVANKAALLVVGNLSLSPGDAVLKARMQSLGFPVVVKKESTTADGDAAGKAFVWLSSTINESVFPGNPFAGVATPVVVQNHGYLDNLRMTTGLAGTAGTQPAQTAVTVSMPTHPLSAGLLNTVTTSQSANYGWGVPLYANRDVVSLQTNPSNKIVFFYELNDPLNEGVALERRLFFGLQEDALAGLGTNGRRLLDAAILWAGRTNAAPWVDAGPPRSATLTGSAGVSVSLAGWVVDDGLPQGSSVTSLWTKAGGPGTVAFQNPSQPATHATFFEPGVHVLRLTASDSLKTSTDLTTVTIIAQGENSAPSVTAGPDQTIRFLQSASLSAIASDDGLPNPLTVSWTKVFGPPGTVVFAPGNALSTQATFPSEGVYLLRVTVWDGALGASDDVQVTVEAKRRALFVVGNAASPTAAELGIVQELKSLGMDATLAPQSVPASEASNKDVVLISDSVNTSSPFDPNFRVVQKPIVLWEFSLYGDLGMCTTDGSAAGGSQVSIVRPGHPLAAGLTQTPTVYSANGPLSFGFPTANAILVGTLPPPQSQPAVFAYERGSVMHAGFAAPARRVGFFGTSTASFTSAGAALLRAAVLWASERPLTALLVVASPSLSPADLAIKERIAALGYGVEVVTGSAATSAHAANKVFVAISNAPDAAAKFRDATTAVLVWDGSVMAAMGMVPPTPNVGYGTSTPQTDVKIEVATHPLAGGLQGQVPAVTSPDTFRWGTPSGGATKIATLVGDANRATVFGHEVGAALDSSVPGSVAADRRVGLFLGPTTGAILTSGGKALVDAALKWAAGSDPDNDGLSTEEEYRLGTNPRDADSNDDGLPDGASVAAGISPTNLDIDGDGLTNAVERAIGTNPHDYDTDDDGGPDGTDCYPLDPRYAGCPTSPNDTTPPVIQLLEPSNAVPVP